MGETDRRERKVERWAVYGPNGWLVDVFRYQTDAFVYATIQRYLNPGRAYRVALYCASNDPSNRGPEIDP